MANEPSARANDPGAPSEDDYQALCAALSATARGRAFLAEYARRQRPADTAMLMAAIERLEGLVRNQAPPPSPVQTPADAIRADLRALLDEIRAAQAENDVGGLTVQVARLAATIEQVERRIETMVAPADAQAFAEEQTPIPPSEADDARNVQRVADVGSFEPAAETFNDAPAQLDGPPELSTDVAPPQAQPTAIPEVGWFDAQPARFEPAVPISAPVPNPAAALAIGAVIEAAAAAAAEEPEAPTITVLKAGTIPPPTPFAGEDFSRAEPAENTPPAPDPLAPIMALSEEERLALFT